MKFFLGVAVSVALLLISGMDVEWMDGWLASWLVGCDIAQVSQQYSQTSSTFPGLGAGDECLGNSEAVLPTPLPQSDPNKRYMLS